MKKEILQIVIKVLIYALGLVAAYLGVTSLTSCSSSHSAVSSGTLRVVSVDTTFIHHKGFIRSKNYRNYDDL